MRCKSPARRSSSCEWPLNWAPYFASGYRMAGFLGVPLPPAKLAKVEQRVSFTTMKNLDGVVGKMLTRKGVPSRRGLAASLRAPLQCLCREWQTRLRRCRHFPGAPGDWRNHFTINQNAQVILLHHPAPTMIAIARRSMPH